jgi:ubiquinone/menaquinone biosynthesis C-methylase UbiE
MTSDPREQMLDRWARAAKGWGKRADRVREHGLPVSMWMIEHAGLQPGQRVLELAAGPGDTGFLAAELIEPGGTLVSSDASDAMLELARSRAATFGVTNIEFAILQLEWIDLPAASVDAALCRWGVMLCTDPPAAAKEVRRVLRPGGRFALAVWDLPERNPWTTIPSRTLIDLGYTSPPDPNAPSMFALAAAGRLRELLEEAGFVEIEVDSVQLDRMYESVAEWLEETYDLSVMFAEVYDALDDGERREVAEKVASLAAPHAQADGGLLLPGRSLVAVASA